jgi:hypothetical protein
MVAFADLLTARTRMLEAERRRERVLGRGFRLPAMFRGCGMIWYVVDP